MSCSTEDQRVFIHNLRRRLCTDTDPAPRYGVHLTQKTYIRVEGLTWCREHSPWETLWAQHTRCRRGQCRPLACGSLLSASDPPTDDRHGKLGPERSTTCDVLDDNLPQHTHGPSLGGHCGCRRDLQDPDRRWIPPVSITCKVWKKEGDNGSHNESFPCSDSLDILFRLTFRCGLQQMNVLGQWFLMTPGEWEPGSSQTRTAPHLECFYLMFGCCMWTCGTPTTCTFTDSMCTYSIQTVFVCTIDAVLMCITTTVHTYTCILCSTVLLVLVFQRAFQFHSPEQGSQTSPPLPILQVFHIAPDSVSVTFYRVPTTGCWFEVDKAV